MIFKEFGNKNNPVILLFHGGGLSWWSLKPLIEELQKNHYVVTPIIDGHGEDWNNTFISIENSATQAIDYIKESLKGKVFAICGLSIGAQIVVEILSKEPDITEYAVIESALVYPMKTTTKLTVPMYHLCYRLIKKRWFAKLQAKTLNVPDDLFETYYLESAQMSKQSLINLTISNGGYSLPLTLCKTKANVLVLVGEKELSIMKKSAKLIHDTIKGSTYKVIKKSGHGEISLIRPNEYLDILQRHFQPKTLN